MPFVCKYINISTALHSRYHRSSCSYRDSCSCKAGNIKSTIPSTKPRSDGKTIIMSKWSQSKEENIVSNHTAKDLGTEIKDQSTTAHVDFEIISAECFASEFKRNRYEPFPDMERSVEESFADLLRTMDEGFADLSRTIVKSFAELSRTTDEGFADILRTLENGFARLEKQQQKQNRILDVSLTAYIIYQFLT